MDMQGLLVARQGHPGPLQPPGPWKAGSSVLGDGASEEKTCTETAVFQLPSQPGERSNMNRDGRALRAPRAAKPLPGPLTQGRKRGSCPLSPAPLVE